MSDQRHSTEALSEGDVGDAASGVASPGSVVSSLTELVRLRETRGFSASLVSSRLRLAPRQIAALEAGDWGALPGRAFIRSSLRSYGRLLEVDVSPLLDAIESQLPGTEVLKPDSELKRPMPRQGALGFGGSGSGNRWVWLLLLLAGVVALAFFYGGGAKLVNRDLQSPVRSTSGSSNGSDAAQSGAGAAAEAPATAAGASSTVSQQVVPVGGAAAPPVAAGVSVAPATTPSTVVPPPVNLPAAPGAAPLAAAATLPVASPAAAASAQQAAAQPAPPRDIAPSVARPAPPTSGATDSRLNPLVMRFPVESWIEVRDAAGTILVTGTQAPGTVRELSGDLPLSLVIGNAAGVVVTWRGTPIDLAPHLRLGVARFRIE